MSTLAQIRDRVELTLMDTGNAIWSTGAIDEALNQALDEYSQVRPLQVETVITLPGDGREIALDSLTGLSEVTRVWWPYDTTAGEVWPPNQVRGWRLAWDDARPVLVLERWDGQQPQQNDEMRIWYAKKQEIENLNSASATTVPLEHESRLVDGAAGFAAMHRVIDLTESATADMYAVSLLGTWGKSKLRDFRAWLETIRAKDARAGAAWGQGWALDKWDERSGELPS